MFFKRDPEDNEDDIVDESESDSVNADNSTGTDDNINKDNASKDNPNTEGKEKAKKDTKVQEKSVETKGASKPKRNFCKGCFGCYNLMKKAELRRVGAIVTGK